MGQAAPARQGVLRSDAQRREDPAVGGGDRLRADREVEAPLSITSGCERNLSNPQRHDPRKNACFRAVFGNPTTQRRT